MINLFPFHLLTKLSYQYPQITTNLYNYNHREEANNDQINNFLYNLSSIADTYYIKGENEIINVDIKRQENLYILCDLNDNIYNKKYHINGVNFYGIRFGRSYYNGEHNKKISDLIYKYQSYFETIHPKDNDVNILLCYDALINTLYDYSENLRKFDMVISSNNYHQKEQLVQKGTTLFFLADQMHKESKLFTKNQPSTNGIDVLNCEYKSLVRKKQ